MDTPKTLHLTIGTMSRGSKNLSEKVAVVMLSVMASVTAVVADDMVADVVVDVVSSRF